MTELMSAQSSREIKKHLMQKFGKEYPELKFSVTLKNGNLRVRWVDGPSETVVKSLLGIFEGAEMIQNGGDSIKSYREYVDWNGKKVNFGLGFVFCDRDLSFSKMKMLMKYVEDRHGYKAPKIEQIGESDEWIQMTFPGFEFDHFLGKVIQTFDAHDVLVWNPVDAG